MKILFLVPYPIGAAPSQRFRFEQYFQFLDQAGIQYDIQSFLDQKTWSILYLPGHYTHKIFGILGGFLRRWKKMFGLSQYDYVFIHREAAPLGPPIFEWWVAKAGKKKIIYDFDDAIWLENVSESNRLFSGLKWYDKVHQIIRWSYKISCGNDFLADFARSINPSAYAVVNPTTIDMHHWHNREKDQNTAEIVIGWTGSHSTIPYLNDLVPVLKKLNEKYQYTFQVISNRKPDWDLPNLRFLPWSKDSEIDDLMQLNVGVMPMPDDQWTRGKCGFKALQYMSLGIPAVVSPVAVNKKIVDQGLNGFLCQTEQEWYEALEQLIQDQSVRIKMGQASKNKILSHYSVASNRANFLNLFS